MYNKSSRNPFSAHLTSLYESMVLITLNHIPCLVWYVLLHIVECALVNRISTQIGTPACTGFDKGGQLTECVRRKPFSVVLIEELVIPMHNVNEAHMVIL